MRPISAVEQRRGPSLPSLKKTPVVAEVRGLPVHLVDESVPLRQRLTLARVAYVAQRSTPDFKAGYDGTAGADDERLYVLRQETRAIALVITALTHRFWQLEWTVGGSLRLRSHEAVFDRRPVVGRVWVASEHRRRGLGVALLARTLSHLTTTPAVVGWTYPFTAAGASLVRRFCPSSLLVCCDPGELHPLLSAESAT